jgi:glucosylceramidase
MGQRHRFAGAALAALGTAAAAVAPAAARAPAPRPKAKSQPSLRVQVIQTSADLSQRLTRLKDLRLVRARPRGLPVIQINGTIGYQKVSGFGGALTDSSAWLIHDELTGTVRTKLMGKLFGPRGIGLGFLRLPMGASDFTRDGLPYSYDDLPTGESDRHLRRFSIAHDRAYVIPTLREALKDNPQLEIVASPWSPPAWMKANNSLSNEDGAGTLLSWAYRPLADYFVKFLQAYRRAGVTISAVTPQNEPGNPTTYPGLQLNEPSEATWIVRDLVPALKAARLTPALYGNDYGWSPRSTAYAQRLLSGRARPALAGLAWHCYFGSPYVMSTAHARARHMDQIVDECAPGITPFPVAEVLISSLRNWASAVALWNLALDPNGGPVQAPNSGCPRCTGVVTVDENAHRVRFGSNYYQMGQVSKFVKPGAQRIASPHFVSYAYTGRGRNFSPGLDDVAFRNPDGSEVLVAYDNSSAPASFAVDWTGGWLTYRLAPGAMVTMVRSRG